MFEKFTSNQESQKSIVDWANETFGEAGSTVRCAIRANEEMAELLKELSQLEANNLGTGNVEKAAKEIADVFIVLYRVASRLGIDVHEVIDSKMAINRKREWVRDGTGHGYHVKKS